MDKVRYGIIGVGSQGSFYANYLTGGMAMRGAAPTNAVLGALCDIDPDKKTMCEIMYPEVPFFTDYKEMIASGLVDAVVTTVPHYLHPVIAIYAIERGMPVLVEKPAGVYAKAVREMNECALAHPDVPFGIMFNQRTNKLYQKLREIVQSGELGEIRRSNWIINSWWRPDSYYRQSAWRATWGGEGGGVLVNQAPHQLDLWQWICGMPSKIYSKIIYGAHRDIVVDNDVTVTAEYPNGATGVFITSTHDPVGTDRLEIDLSGGKIVVEDSKKATVTRFKKTEDEMNQTMDMRQLSMLVMGGKGDQLYTTETIENTDGWGVQHGQVLTNFAAKVLGEAELLAPGTDGINGVQLANAILLSSWLGKEVDVPVDEEIYIAELNKKIEAEGKFPTI
ncbi:MAG: Gfo/Idh/MocA family oxidoreductase [Clostridia bacterium]|nr:Gfo/Idh/MocA family oxidoreductase [Clostridia bacterium]